MGCIWSCVTGKKVPTNEATVAQTSQSNRTLTRPSGMLPVPTAGPTNEEPPSSPSGRVAYPVIQSPPIRNIDQEIAYSRPPPTPPFTIGSPPNQFSRSIHSTTYSPSIQGSTVSMPKKTIPQQISLISQPQPQPQGTLQSQDSSFSLRDSVSRPPGQSRIEQAPPPPHYTADFTPRTLMASRSADCLGSFPFSQNDSRHFLPSATRGRTHSTPIAHQDRQAISTTQAGRSASSSPAVSIYQSPTGNMRMYVIFLVNQFTFLIDKKSSSIKPQSARSEPL